MSNHCISHSCSSILHILEINNEKAPEHETMEQQNMTLVERRNADHLNACNISIHIQMMMDSVTADMNNDDRSIAELYASFMERLNALKNEADDLEDKLTPSVLPDETIDAVRISRLHMRLSDLSDEIAHFEVDRALAYCEHFNLIRQTIHLPRFNVAVEPETNEAPITRLLMNNLYDLVKSFIDKLISEFLISFERGISESVREITSTVAVPLMFSINSIANQLDIIEVEAIEVETIEYNQIEATVVMLNTFLEQCNEIEDSIHGLIMEHGEIMRKRVLMDQVFKIGYVVVHQCLPFSYALRASPKLATIEGGEALTARIDDMIDAMRGFSEEVGAIYDSVRFEEYVLTAEEVRQFEAVSRYFHGQMSSIYTFLTIEN
jgi:hypothetical protein